MFLILAIISTSNFAQGKLDDIKEELRAQKLGANESRRVSESESEDANNTTYYSDPFEELLVELGMAITYGILFETSWENELPMHSAQFTRYPYFDNESGNYTYDTNAEYFPFKVVLSGGMHAENKHLYGHDFGLQLKLFDRADISLRYNSLIEKQNIRTNQIDIYNIMVHYHRLRMPKFDLWYGLGATHLGGIVEETGFSLDFGAEWFIKKPISLFAQWKHSWFDNNLSTSQTIYSVRYYIQQFNIEFGMKKYRFFSTRIKTLSLGVNIFL